MNVSLTPELESWIQQKVNSGLYQTSSEVIREGLRILRERDNLCVQMTKDLKNEILLGVEDLAQGRSEEFTGDTIREIKKTGRSCIEADFK